MNAASRDATREQFERRMRTRRAATCVRAARQAIAEGRVVEAEERLDEACRLDPDEAEARLLLEELQASRVLESEGGAIPGAALERRGGSGWSHWLAAGVAIAALAALAFFWQPDDAPRRDTPARRAPIELPAAVHLQPHVDTPLTAETDQPPGLVGTTGSAQSAAGTGQGERREREPRRSATPTATGIAARQLPADNASSRPHEPQRGRDLQPATQAAITTDRPVPAPADAPPPSRPPDPAVGQTESQARPPESLARPEDPPARLLEAFRQTDAAVRADVGSRPAAGRDAAAPQPDPALASLRPPAPGQTDDELIRATLGRFADAYRRLDVSAAQQVWPSVDVQALRRAFDGLESQGIAFERCELRVTGSDATAACRGRASYVPKVGGREPLSVSRLWIFALRKDDAGWTIRSADAR